MKTSPQRGAAAIAASRFVKQRSLMRFLLLIGMPLILLGQEIREKIVVAAPFATVSHPVLRMIDTNALGDVARKVEFRLWKNPDELRAMVLRGDVDFAAVPTNTAAILYNKGVDIKLVNVSIWGILAMLSRDDNLKTLNDYKGKEVVVPFRADMPDLVLEALLKEQGIDKKEDIKLRYVASPIDAMQMLILRRVDHALLAEPAISIALRKTKSFPISVVAPELFRSVDLQEEWARVYRSEAALPQAGIAALGETARDGQLIQRFLEEYDKALAWYQSHPEEAGELVVKTLPMLQAEGVADSIAHVNIKSVRASDARKQIETFFEVMQREDPKIVGGRLPDAGFYH